MKEIHFDGNHLPPARIRSHSDGSANAPAESFGERVQTALNDLSRLQQQSDQAVERMTTGQKVDVHQTMVALEKASVTFELIMQVRNKIVAAYEEVMRMQI